MGSGIEISQPPGVAVDLINAVTKQLGIAVNYERYPNARALQLLASGEIDGAFMFSYNPEREEIGRYPQDAQGQVDGSKRLARLSYWLYSLQDSAITWDGQRLTGVSGTLAAEHGDSIIQDLASMGHSVQQPKSAYHALLMLKRRENVIGAALQDIKAQPLLNNAELSGIKRSSLPLRSKDYFLIFSHRFYDNHPTLAKGIWQVIEAQREKLTQRSLQQYSSQ